jgi:GNAT superfamily N-acetyltransferase
MREFLGEASVSDGNNNITYRVSSHSNKEKRISMELVRESFGETDMAYEEYYDWLFLKNPIGTGTVLIAYDGDLPIGQVASIPCKYIMPNEEKPIIITLTMNVCVSPNYRGRGILTQLMDRIHRVGTYSVPFSVGIPNSQSMRGHLKNGYHPLPMKLLIRPVRLSNYFSNPVIRKFVEPFYVFWRNGMDVEDQEFSERFDERFDSLLYLHQELIRQVRNSDFLNWRYLDNPRRKYKIFVAMNESKKEVLGYLIARVTEVFGMRVGLIVDFISKDSSQCIKNLILNALRYFWESAVTFAVSVCFANCIEYRLLKNSGFFIIPDRFKPHPLAVCVKLLDEANYKQNVLLNANNWFFMLGDYETF